MKIIDYKIVGTPKCITIAFAKWFFMQGRAMALHLSSDTLSDLKSVLCHADPKRKGYGALVSRSL